MAINKSLCSSRWALASALVLASVAFCLLIFTGAAANGLVFLLERSPRSYQEEIGRQIAQHGTLERRFAAIVTFRFTMPKYSKRTELFYNSSLSSVWVDPESKSVYAVGSEWLNTDDKSGLVVTQRHGMWTGNRTPGVSALNGVAGISSGAIYAAGKSANRPNNPARGVVVNLSDGGSDLIPQASELKGIAIFHEAVIAVGEAGPDDNPKGVVVSGGPGHWRVEEVANVSSLTAVWVDSKGTVRAVGYSQPPGTTASKAVGVVATKVGNDWRVDQLQGTTYLASIGGNDEGDVYVAGETQLPNGGKKAVLGTMTTSGWTVETLDKNSQFRSVLADHSNPYVVGLGWNGQEDSPEVAIAARKTQGGWRIQWISDAYILSGIARSTPGHSIAVGRFKTGYRDFEHSNGVAIDERGAILWNGDLYRRVSEDLHSGTLQITTEYQARGVLLWACVLAGLFLLWRDPKLKWLRSAWSELRRNHPRHPRPKFRWILAALALLAASVTLVLYPRSRQRATGTPSATIEYPQRLIEIDNADTLFAIASQADGTRSWAVGGTGQILSTSDGGNSWQPATIRLTAAQLLSVAFSADGDIGLAASDSGDVLRTADKGASWHTVQLPGETKSINSLVLLGDGRRGWLARGNQIFRTSDGGESWQQIQDIADVGYLLGLTFQNDGLRGWVVGAKGAALRTDDGGFTWRRIIDIPSNEDLDGVSFDETGSHGLITGGRGTVLATADKGLTWTPVNVGPRAGNFGRPRLSADGREAWIPTEGELLVSRDGAVTWTAVPIPMQETMLAIDFPSWGKRGFAVGVHGTILVTEDGGQNWRVASKRKTIPKLTEMTLSPDGQIILGVTSELRTTEIVRSEDGGNTWLTTFHSDSLGGLFSVIFNRNGVQAWAVGNEKLLRSYNGGFSWQEVKHAEAYLGAISFGADGKRGVAVGWLGSILWTEDSGQSWHRVDGLPAELTLKAVAVSKNGLHAIAVGDAGSILITGDGGRTWQAVQTDATDEDLNSVSLDENGLRAVAVGKFGVAVETTDGGKSWKPVNLPSHGDFDEIVFDAAFKQGWIAGESEVKEGLGATLLRTNDGGKSWIRVAPSPAVLKLFSLAFSADGRLGVALAQEGEEVRFLRTDSPAYAPVIEDADVRVDGGSLRLVVKASDKETPQSRLLVDATVTGDSRTSIAGEALSRHSVLSDLPKIEPWRRDFFDDNTNYTFTIRVSNGWNISERKISKHFGISRWEAFRQFMGWNIPTNVGDFVKSTLPQNVSLFTGLYYFLIVLAFVVRPDYLVRWHAWIWSSDLPIKDKALRVLSPFGLSDRCLDVTVQNLRARALELFSAYPDVNVRRKWVPAPLKIQDDVILNASAVDHAAPDGTYVAGLSEIRRYLKGDRWTISIEGPGGVGKSALAFQFGRWVLDSRPDYRLAPHPMLAILVKLPTKNVDTDALAVLQQSLGLASPELCKKLLMRRRVLVVADGVSEAAEQDLGALQPGKGASAVHAMVVTSRRPTELLESLLIRPLAVNLTFLDRILDDLVASTIGGGVLSPEERELLRDRIKAIMSSIGTERAISVPMIFLNIMVDRAKQLLAHERKLDELPKTLDALVTEYVSNLARSEADVSKAVREIRRAAVVCIGSELRPRYRSLADYTLEDISEHRLEQLVTDGLMMRSGEPGDPFYKFALDPIAEYLAASECAIRFRDKIWAPDKLNDRLNGGDNEDFRSLVHKMLAADKSNSGSALA
jgi:photosystem II stability/assembly factor-like uncharacterized protein